MPVPVESGRHARSLLRDSVYTSLRDAIVDGTLSPGERLRDTELEKWLGVSRTPIRDAIARLETAGLVRTKPGRFTVVSTIEQKAVLDAQSVAATLHALAIRTAVPLMSDDDIEAMRAANRNLREAFDSGDPDGALRYDSEFHDVAVSASQNQVIAGVLEQVTPVLRRLERLKFGSLAGRTSITQHQNIIELCIASEADKAAAETARNWELLSAVVDQ
ncbi:GntR family transcriptional regulator [Tsukamurella serpentis]